MKCIQETQTEDIVCTHLCKNCEEEWQRKDLLPNSIKPYFQFSSELNVQRYLLLKGIEIIIPTSMQLEVLDGLHHAH